MRRPSAAAAALLGLLALTACQRSPFPPNVAPPRSGPPPHAPDTQKRSSFDAPTHLSGPLIRVQMRDVPGKLPGTPEDQGRRYAEAYCSACHAVSGSGASPNPDAPPFRIIVKRYPPDDLAEAFNEGIVVGHPKMPPFVFSPERAEDLIAYLTTLKS